MEAYRNEMLLYIIRETSKYCTESGNKLGKKFLQKVIYLLQKKGVNLGYNFSIHYYGPYSSQLEFDIHKLEIQGLVKINSVGYTHEIIPEDVTEIDEKQQIVDIYSDEQRINVQDLIKELCGYKAYRLELIATVDFIINQLIASKIEPLTQEEIIEKVKKLKGNKYSEQQIIDAINFLKKYNFVKL